MSMKSREQTARRKAKRQGYRLAKSRRRDPQALDHGLWGIFDPDLNVPVTPAHPVTGGPFYLTLAEAEAWLETQPYMASRERLTEYFAPGTMDHEDAIDGARNDIARYRKRGTELLDAADKMEIGMKVRGIG